MMKVRYVSMLCLAITCRLVEPAYAAPTMSPVAEAAVARCISRASNGKPWLEMTLWGLRDQEAGWVGAEILNANGSHDLGILQINSSWIPAVARLVRRSSKEVRQWLRFDPCFNADTARWLFLSALAQTRDYWKAVGLYHSPTEWRQRKYAASVAAHLRVRFGACGACLADGSVSRPGASKP